MTDHQRRFLTGPITPLAVLLISVVISLVFFAVFQPKLDGRVFFYPDNAGTKIGTERRGVPQRHNLDSRIEVFLNELALGPVQLELSKTMPRGTRIRHVAVLEKTAYVDLNTAMLNVPAVLSVDFDQALENIRYNILFNFPRIDEVVFTIEGQQVHAPYYIAPDTPE